MEQETLKTERTDLNQVDYRNIVVEEGFNKRGENNYGDIEGLAHSVVALGVLDPIIGFKVRGKDQFVMTEGHRRLRAVKLAHQYHKEGKAGFEDISKIERIPLRSTSSDLKERLLTMAVTGAGKVPLTDLEKADLYNSLIELDVQKGIKRGAAIKTLVTTLGVSQATVYNILKINELPELIKDYISKGEISGSTVVAIVREIKDEAEQIKVVEDAIISAQATAEKQGGKSKATAANVTGLKAKSPLQRLKEVAEKLENKEVTNSRTKLLNELLVALEEKRSVNKMLDLFL